MFVYFLASLEAQNLGSPFPMSPGGYYNFLVCLHKHKEFPKSLGWGKERKIRKQTGDGKKERVRCMERVTRKQTEEEPNRKGVEHFRWLRQSEVIAN